MTPTKQNFYRAFQIHACDFLGEDPRNWNLTNEEIDFTRRAKEEI